MRWVVRLIAANFIKIDLNWRIVETDKTTQYKANQMVEKSQNNQITYK